MKKEIFNALELNLVRHVSLHNLRATCSEGISILRNEGLLPFIRAGLRELNLNHRGFYYYLNYLHKYYLPSYQTAEPLTVLNVDPQRIRCRAPRDIDRWENIGEVRAGAWDCSNSVLEDGSKYRSVVNRFKNDTSWEETDIYQEAIKQIESGGTHWNGCRAVEDVERRINHIEKLYQTIRDSGFKSQSELHGKSVKSILLSGSFDRSKTDIAVAIGRNGEFLFVDGNHRLAIAHILGIKQVPVRVIVRHLMWQDLREEIHSTKTKQDLSKKAQTHLTHPDVSDRFT